MTERRLVFLIGAIQFVNILDFMMVMPLGPDFARGLDIPSSQLGLVGGSYTLAAGVAGVAGAFFLDRFDRRKALGVALGGLVLGTAAGGLATGLISLLAARVVAGAFGGPASALALAIITDAVPPERRGRAMGAVMGAFAVASVFGVPAGLELARLGGWRAPFFVVAALAALIGAIAVTRLPAIGQVRRDVPAPFRKVLRRPVVGLALGCTALAVLANFALVPNLAAYFQFNRGYPREQLGLLYLVGGTLSFATTRLAGWLTDRHGAAVVGAAGSAAFIVVLIVGFAAPVTSIPVLAVFCGFMIAGSFRFVPLNALSSRVPAPSERARFMSAQSAVQHFASAAGALFGAALLVEVPGGALRGMDDLAWFGVAASLLLPVLLVTVERLVPRPVAIHAGTRR
jgi:predicted MFS family arabinose efflux permease